MNAQRWRSLQEAFDMMAELQPDEQARALRRLRGDDPVLAEEVRELLEEDALGQRMPEMSVESLLQQTLQEDAPPLDKGLIGPYRILKLLGEGGMGVVYLAERTDIAGYVALKLLRDAWLSPARRQRFALEQQMLGLLKHASIARIYDAGTTNDGTPWFVMEFFDGIPITDYVQQHSSPVREIAELIGKVSEAVRYAHSFAIIHRDLKPSNILVNQDGQVKLLDFGIAKQMDIVNRGDATTTTGLRLFTPAYAAPELQGDNRVGVFTDIYSVGVIFYQLLTARLPFPAGSRGDRDPQRPSRVRADTAERKRELSSIERADVDAICFKALARTPEDRYLSTDAFIADINAFIEERPIEAKRQAVLYTAGKFLHRNRALVLSSALALLVIVCGTVAFTIRLARARDAAGRARDQAIAEAARSARVQRFTASLFTGGGSHGVPPPGIRVSQMLDRGRAEALLMTGDPLLQADMFQALGTAYWTLRDPGEAEPLLREAQRVICRLERSIECANVELDLGLTLGDHGSTEESQAFIRDAVLIRRAKLAPTDPAIAQALVSLSVATWRLGDRTQGRDLAEQALAIASAPGRPTPQLASALEVFAIVGVSSYNDPRAIEYMERGARINERLYGVNSYEHAGNEEGIGKILLDYGRYRQSERYFRSALTDAQAWSGKNEPVNAGFMNALASALVLERHLGEAKKVLQRSLAITMRGKNSSTLVEGEAEFYLGFIALEQGDLATADTYFESVLAIAHRHQAVDELFVEYSELGLAQIDSTRGDNRRAEASIRQVLATTKLKPSYVVVAGMTLLGHVLLCEGKIAEAETDLKPAYAWFSHDATRPHTAMAYQDLAQAETLLGRPKAAARILAELRARKN